MVVLYYSCTNATNLVVRYILIFGHYTNLVSALKQYWVLCISQFGID